MIYQEPTRSLNPAMTLGRQLIEVPLTHNAEMSQAAAHARCLEVLEGVRLPDPERIMKAYPHQISGGQQQRIVIAMGLLSNPKLLLLDEPTTALDVTVEAGIVELIKEIAERFGTSMIYISHNLGLILETCHKTCVMYAGQAVEVGPTPEIFRNKSHPYSSALMNSLPLPGLDKTVRPLRTIPGQLPLPNQRPIGCYFGPRCDYFEEAQCGQKPISMTKVREKHTVRCARYKDIDLSVQAAAAGEPPVEVGEAVLKIKDVVKHYEIADTTVQGLLSGKVSRTIKANQGFSFDVHEAETLAIVGESGCGKSTFAKVILGLEKATSGQVHFLGDSIEKIGVRRRPKKLRRNLQMIFQNPFDTLNPSHTIGGQLGRVLKLFSDRPLSAAQVRDKTNELMDLVQLPREFARRRPRQLSGGQKQRVGIARAFAGGADLIVADEPVSALDVSVQAAIVRLLTDLQRENRTTLIFISHDLALVHYLSDRVVVMYLGHIVEQGTTEQVFAPPYHPYTEALLSSVPVADPDIEKKNIVLGGELPSPLNPPPGCPFQTRCPHKIEGLCEKELPPHRVLAPGHEIMCPFRRRGSPGDEARHRCGQKRRREAESKALLLIGGRGTGPGAKQARNEDKPKDVNEGPRGRRAWRRAWRL